MPIQLFTISSSYSSGFTRLPQILPITSPAFAKSFSSLPPFMSCIDEYPQYFLLHLSKSFYSLSFSLMSSSIPTSSHSIPHTALHLLLHLVLDFLLILDFSPRFLNPTCTLPSPSFPSPSSTLSLLSLYRQLVYFILVHRHLLLLLHPLLLFLFILSLLHLLLLPSFLLPYCSCA